MLYNLWWRIAFWKRTRCKKCGEEWFNHPLGDKSNHPALQPANEFFPHLVNGGYDVEAPW